MRAVYIVYGASRIFTRCAVSKRLLKVPSGKGTSVDVDGRPLEGSAYGIANHSPVCQGVLITVAARGNGTAPSRFVVAEEMPRS